MSTLVIIQKKRNTQECIIDNDEVGVNLQVLTCLNSLVFSYHFSFLVFPCRLTLVYSIHVLFVTCGTLGHACNPEPIYWQMSLPDSDAFKPWYSPQGLSGPSPCVTCTAGWCRCQLAVQASCRMYHPYKARDMMKVGEHRYRFYRAGPWRSSGQAPFSLLICCR